MSDVVQRHVAAEPDPLKRYAKHLVENAIEAMFIEAGDAFALQSGDCDPMCQFKIDEAKETLASAIVHVVQVNVPYVEDDTA